jgi:hypothetical protein
MARKELKVTIDAEGRDHGKIFLIKEMSASDIEDWGVRVLLGLAKSGVEIPDDVASAGIAGVAQMGLKALGGMEMSHLRPLLEEMMGCIEILPDPSNHKLVRSLVEDDIEEFKTRLTLRAQWFSLHTGFSMPGVNSNSISATGKKVHRNSPNI